MLRPNRVVEAGIRVVDGACIAAAMPVAYAARDALVGESKGWLYPLADYWPLVALALLLWQGTAWIFGVYHSSFRTKSLGSELWHITKAAAALGLSLAAMGFVLHLQQDVSRLLVGLFLAVSLALLVANRFAARALARHLRRKGRNSRIYAVVGSCDLAREVVDSVAAHPEWGMQFAGHILEDDVVREVPKSAVLGRVSQLGQVLDDNVIDEVIFAVPRERLGEVESAVYLCEEQGVSVRVCLDLFDQGLSRFTLSDLDGLPVLSHSRTPTDDLALAVKRAFDVVTSAAVLLALSPILLTTALAIKIESRGPIFFRQVRVGLNGRPFRILKFRSMHVDAEAKLDALRKLNEAKGPVFKIRDDPRVTRVGRFIRRTSIDELPQFWNVLVGEMSVVGPRPPIPSEVRQYKRWQRRRLSVRPGITCTWQVSGRSNIDFDQWMELDLKYIDNWSLWKDIEICFRTIPAVFLARGAH
jgi:exopolysaccharide biosynthesis polyprenyl glycosylphosphotransferase